MIATDHDEFDYDKVDEEGKLVIDTRNMVKNKNGSIANGNILKLGSSNLLSQK